jgi:hypothetical protein
MENGRYIRKYDRKVSKKDDPEGDTDKAQRKQFRHSPTERNSTTN